LRFTPLEVSFDDDQPPDAAVAHAMARLRVAYRRGRLAALVRSLDGTSTPFQTFTALTDLADEAAAAAFKIAAMDTARRSSRLRSHANFDEVPFAVLALGRLGTREMDIASDADVIFIADEKLSAADREPWRKLAERFVHIVSSHTREGLIFPVDTRLRAHGGEGEIVQSLGALRQYLRSEAQAWEAATYLKARCVGGNAKFGAEAVQHIRRMLRERWSDRPCRAELARELAVMRARLEREGTGPKSRTEFKHLRGGFYDIEYVTTLGFFRSAGDKPPREAFPPGANALQQVAGLREAGALAQHHAETLLRTATLFRSVDHAHRLVTGRAPGRPPEPAVAERLVRLLDQWRVALPDPSPAGLEAALAEARTQTRAVYDAVVVHALM
jgi:glutamate-ammonia-ligase adenylyltransferase